MIDDKIIKQLDSPDAEVRRQAVKTLAQTKDREALKYLATIYKTDSDPDVRELALKAGKYIQKVAPDEAPSTGASSFTSPVDAVAEHDPYPDEDEEPASRSLRPEEIEVSTVDEERAHGFVQQAMNMHMRGEDAKALQILTRAFKINPKLQYDKYATGLVATITGKPVNEVLELLAPAMEEGIKEKQKRSERSVGQSTGAHTTVVFLMMAGALLLLISYMAMPWVDLSSIPIEDEFGQQITFGESLDELREQMNTEMGIFTEMPETEVPGMEEMEELAQRFVDALDGLTIQFSGFDSTLLTLGFTDIIEVMGLRNLLEVVVDMLSLAFGGEVEGMMEEFEIVDEVQPGIMDFTLLLTPLVAIIAIGLSLTMLVTNQSASLRLWGVSILVGLIGIVPLLYFYLDAAGSVMGDSGDLGAFGQLAGEISGKDLLGIGFWASLVGALIILILPFIALLLPHPHAQSE